MRLISSELFPLNIFPITSSSFPPNAIYDISQSESEPISLNSITFYFLNKFILT